MKLTINCIENGGFTGRYDLPGFGCVLLVNAEGNIVTIEVIDEEQDRINAEIEEERLERTQNMSEEEMTPIVEDYYPSMDDEEDEIMFVDGYDEDDELTFVVGDDEDGDLEDEVCDNEDGIEDTFEYKFIKSIQETDESGTVLKFLETLLDEYKNQEMTEGDMPTLQKLLVGISDYVNQNDEDKV